jgi:hypothetical protein
MSFFFFGGSSINTGWTIVVGARTTWTLHNPDFKNLWGDWAGYTWSQIGA